MMNGALDFLEGWWEYHLKGPIQYFINGIIKLEDADVDFCTGVVSLFA
jgi:hypothetical protein